MSYRGCTQGTRREVPNSCIHVLPDGLSRFLAEPIDGGNARETFLAAGRIAALP